MFKYLLMFAAKTLKNNPFPECLLKHFQRGFNDVRLHQNTVNADVVYGLV